MFRFSLLLHLSISGLSIYCSVETAIVYVIHPYMPAPVTTVTVSDDPQGYEDEHVHSVYDEIASHFSSTRYKVSSFQVFGDFITRVLFASAMANNRAVHLIFAHRVGWPRLGYWQREISAFAFRSAR